MSTERPESIEPVPPEPTPTEAMVPVAPERATRRLNGDDTRRARVSRPLKTVPTREQTAALVAALGDMTHPLHITAVDELVALGPDAAPALNAALHPDQPWLTIYRAAEAAGRIGDGRTASALIQALNHPNSNVRWGAVRALTQIGDVRALFELRRVAQHDQGRTTWGESVAATAQASLNELGRRSVWGQSLELIKTATAAILMVAALIFAFSTVSTLRAEIDRFGRVIPGQNDLPLLILPTAVPRSSIAPQPTRAAALQPTALAEPTAQALQPTAELPALAPTGAAPLGSGLLGLVTRDANVRPLPNTDNQPIGRLATGDEIQFIAQTSNGEWFRISLRSSGAQINSPDGTGWISQSLVTPPTGTLPIEDPLPPVVPTVSP
ncbi:MAG: HEAT repeat domain-containing protein [Oscillochloridaceae bacterium umkhey_bin13]